MRVLVRRVRGRKNAPNWSGIVDEVAKTMERTVKPRLLEYPERIVANWEHKPRFRAIKKINKDEIAVYVYPTGPNAKYWQWTSRGTKPHKIKPKKASVLAFPTGYTPKTTPRGPSYGGPGTAHGETVFAKEVDHPGTKARKFEEAWGRWAKGWFAKDIENAMRRGVRNARNE